MAGKIFINYRRDDAISTAGRLHDRLAQTFGPNNLFMDVDHIPAGVDFVEYLHSQVAACDVFLAIIGPNWLNAKDDEGRRRFDNPDDYVKIEIAAALVRDIRVIPVLVDGARPPNADKLPDSVKPLARRNAVEVRNTNFGRDTEALADKIRDALKGARPATGQRRFVVNAVPRFIPSGRWRAVWGGLAALLLVGWIGLYQVGVPVWVPWQSDASGTGKAAADAEAKRKAAEAEQQRLKEEVDRQAQAAADAESKRKAAEAEQQRLQEEAQRQAKAEADAEAKRKAAEAEQQRLVAMQAEQQRQAQAAADVEAKLKAAEAEQQRLKEEAQRQAQAAADAEAKRKAAETEQQRLKEEAQRQAQAAADAEAKRKAAEAEQQRLKEEVERQAQAAADAEVKRNAAEAEQQRLAAVKAEQDRNARAEAENAAKRRPDSSPSRASFERRSGMVASGSEISFTPAVGSIDECEQKCTHSTGCTVFSFNKSVGSCYLYSRAGLTPDGGYDSGIRIADKLSQATSTTYERRSNMIANGSEISFTPAVGSIEECEQKCTTSSRCTVFTFNKTVKSCYLYLRADLRPDYEYDSGIRK
jgi:TIR domain/PAN domain